MPTASTAQLRWVSCRMLAPLRVAFIAGPRGAWQIERLECVVGDSLPAADRLSVVEGLEQPAAEGAAWVLRGVTSNSNDHRKARDFDHGDRGGARDLARLNQATTCHCSTP